jgi:hypothetical protein
MISLWFSSKSLELPWLNRSHALLHSFVHRLIENSMQKCRWLDKNKITKWHSSWRTHQQTLRSSRIQLLWWKVIRTFQHHARWDCYVSAYTWMLLTEKQRVKQTCCHQLQSSRPPDVQENIIKNQLKILIIIYIQKRVKIIKLHYES